MKPRTESPALDQSHESLATREQISEVKGDLLHSEESCRRGRQTGPSIAESLVQRVVSCFDQCH